MCVVSISSHFMELERALELELKKNELNKKGIGIGIELKGVGIII